MEFTRINPLTGEIASAAAVRQAGQSASLARLRFPGRCGAEPC
jgi:hypothetical protein